MALSTRVKPCGCRSPMLPVRRISRQSPAVLAQRPDLKTPTAIDRKLPSYTFLQPLWFCCYHTSWACIGKTSLHFSIPVRRLHCTYARTQRKRIQPAGLLFRGTGHSQRTRSYAPPLRTRVCVCVCSHVYVHTSPRDAHANGTRDFERNDRSATTPRLSILSTRAAGDGEGSAKERRHFGAKEPANCGPGASGLFSRAL